MSGVLSSDCRMRLTNYKTNRPNSGRDSYNKIINRILTIRYSRDRLKQRRKKCVTVPSTKICWMYRKVGTDNATKPKRLSVRIYSSRSVKSSKNLWLRSSPIRSRRSKRSRSTDSK